MNPHDSASPPENESQSNAPASYPWCAVLVLLWLLAGTVVIPLVSHARAHATHVIQTGLDPNVAPWWELSLLPRLGPAVAKEIVQHRTMHVSPDIGACAFGQASDLLPVQGIGPKNLLRIGPHLHFDSCPPAMPNEKLEGRPSP